jgi:hypothetical protein
VASIVHCVPFQRSTAPPTAVQALADAHEMLDSPPTCAALGVPCTVHRVPSQRSTNARVALVLSS